MKDYKYLGTKYLAENKVKRLKVPEKAVSFLLEDFPNNIPSRLVVYQVTIAVLSKNKRSTGSFPFEVFHRWIPFGKSNCKRIKSESELTTYQGKHFCPWSSTFSIMQRCNHLNPQLLFHFYWNRLSTFQVFICKYFSTSFFFVCLYEKKGKKDNAWRIKLWRQIGRSQLSIFLENDTIKRCVICQLGEGREITINQKASRQRCITQNTAQFEKNFKHNASH